MVIQGIPNVLELYNHNPTIIKPFSRERFSFWSNSTNLPRGKIITKFWFEEESIKEHLDIKWRLEIFTGKFGCISWNPILLGKLSFIKDIYMDTRNFSDWYIEFVNPRNETIEFSPRIWMFEII